MKYFVRFSTAKLSLIGTGRVGVLRTSLLGTGRDGVLRTVQYSEVKFDMYR